MQNNALQFLPGVLGAVLWFGGAAVASDDDLLAKVRAALTRLPSGSDEGRREAARALADFAQSAVLLEALSKHAQQNPSLPKSPDPAAALAELRGAAPVVILAVLNDADPEVRRLLRATIPALGAAGRAEIDRHLATRTGPARSEALLARLETAMERSEAENCLPAAARDADARVRVRALERAGERYAAGGGPLWHDVLLDALTDPARDVRLAAVRRLDTPQPAPESAPGADALARMLPLHRDSDPEVRAAAVHALSRFGVDRSGKHRDAVAGAAAAAARDSDRNVRHGAISWLAKLPPDVAVPALLPLLEDPDPSIAFGARSVVANLGAEAVPGIVSALAGKDDALSVAACEASGVIVQRERTPGPAYSGLTAPLLVALKESAPRGRARAAFALGRLRDSNTIPDLIGALGDSDPATRAEVVGALAHQVWGGHQPEQRPAVLAAFGRALDDSTAAVRVRVVATLADLGAPAAEVLPLLERAEADADRGVRDAAEKTRQRLPRPARSEDRRAPAADPATAALDPAVARSVATIEKEPANAVAAVDALAALGPAALAAVPALAGVALHAEAADARERAALALVRIDGAAAAMPLLRGGLADSRDPVRIAAADALGCLGPAGGSAVAALVTALSDSYGGVRAAAARALGRIGPEARESLSGLLGAWRDPDVSVRSAAGGAAALVWRADPERARFFAALTDRGQPEAARAGALYRLADLPPDRAREVAPRLAALLAEADAGSSAAGAAEQALERMGEAAAGAVPRLIEVARRGPHQAAAARILGKLGTTGEAAVPALTALLGADDAAGQNAAATGVSLLGPLAEPALPALIRAYQKRPREYSLAIGLSELGWIFPEARRALAEGLRHRDADARMLAASSLDSLGRAARDCREALQAATKDGDQTVALIARGALDRMVEEPPASPAAEPGERNAALGALLEAARRLDTPGNEKAAASAYWKIWLRPEARGTEAGATALRRVQGLARSR